jgi:Ca2+-binding EF-hand superfamily protein
MIHSSYLQLIKRKPLPLLCGAALLSACLFQAPSVRAEIVELKMQTEEAPKEPVKYKYDHPEYKAAIDLFDSFDLNKDGVVADYELSYVAKRDFRKKDLNKNGELTPFENIQGSFHLDTLKLPAEIRQDQKLTVKDLEKYETWFYMVDVNKDKVITQYENLRFFRDEFKKFDTENKGKATREEYLEYLDSLFAPKKKKK